jgi:hypothetical protein
VGLACVLTGAGLGGAVGSALVTLGIVLPGVLVQDLWRQVFFARGRPSAAALNDAVWAVVQVVGVIELVARHAVTASSMLIVWGASAAVAALVGVVQAGVWPAPRRALDWVREHRDINGYLAAEFVTLQGALNAGLLLIGALGAVDQVGALRGVQTVLGPTTIFAVGVVSWAVPEFSRHTRMDTRSRLRWAVRISAVVGGAGVVWGLLFWVVGDLQVGGHAIGYDLLGDTWAGTRHVLGLSLLQQAGAAATVGVSCMLIAMGQARRTFRANALAAPQLIVYPVVGELVGGATGAVAGFALANWIMVPLFFRLLVRAAREADEERARAHGERDDAPGSAARPRDEAGSRPGQAGAGGREAIGQRSLTSAASARLPGPRRGGEGADDPGRRSEGRPAR